MDKEAIEKLLLGVAEKHKAAIKTQIEEAGKALATKEELEAKVKELSDKLEAQETEAKEQKDILEKQGLEMQKLGKSKKETATLKEEIDSNKELIAKASSKQIKEASFNITKANVTRASVTNSTQAYRLNDIGQLAHRALVARNAFTVIRVPAESNGVIRYADWDQATSVRAAAMVAEGAAFPESEAVWEEYTLDLKKIGDTIPVTEETVQDAGRFADELDSFLETNVAIIEDTQLLTGDGTGNNLNGIYPTAPEYVAAAAGISDASIYDLIVKMSEAITGPYGGKYMPDFAFMNIADINKMKLKKDANENYILPPFVTNGGVEVDGITIIEANGITADTMVLGDSRFARLYEVEGYNIAVGYVDGQFAADLMTLKAKKRENLLIRTVDQTGFLKETGIAAALVTLAT